MDFYRSFIQNNRGILIGHILIYGQGLILMPLIIKTVGVAVYGGYIAVLTTLGFVYGISSFGVGFKNTRFLPAAEGKEARSILFYPQFFFQCVSIAVLSVLLMCFFPFLDKYLFKGDLVFSKWLIFPYLFSNFLFSQTVAYYISTHRVSRFNYATIAFPYLNIALITAVYLLRRTLSVNMLFLTQIASYLLLTAPLIFGVVTEIGVMAPALDVKSLTEDAKIGFPLRINYVMDFLLNSSDRYMIMYFMTVVAVGYYNPGYAVGSLILFLPKVSGVVLPPLLSKAIDNGRQTEACAMLNYTVKGYLLLAIPFVAGTVVIGARVLSMFANPDVSAKGFWVAPIIALATLFFGLNIILSNVLLVRMKTSVLFKINSLAAAVNIALNLAFMAVCKTILVAAFTTLISYGIALIFIRKAVIEDWPLQFEPVVMLKSIAASVFMGVAMYCAARLLWADASGLVPIAGLASVGFLIYTLSLLVMRTFSPKELLYMKKAFT